MHLGRYAGRAALLYAALCFFFVTNTAAIDPTIISMIVKLAGSKLLGSIQSGIQDGKFGNLTDSFISNFITKITDEILNKNHKDDISQELNDFLGKFQNESDAKREDLTAELKAIAKDISAKHDTLMGGSATVDVIPSKGFNYDGEMFSPPEYKIKTEWAPEPEDAEIDPGPAFEANKGLGSVLLNGCYKPSFSVNDPCYAAKRLLPKCQHILDSSNFIGVGFDGRGDYSSESRKKSIIQRVCNRGGVYKGKAVPDSMTVLGIYDTDVKTQSFNSIHKYQEYLEEKASVAKSKYMFIEAITKATGHASAGILGLAGGGGGASMQASASGSGQSTSFSSSASGYQTESFKQTYLSTLEVDVIRYEIFLDDVSVNDLNMDFLHDFVHLPESYFYAGAPLRFQQFIIKWGTHFIKAAKFGGQLKLIKTKEGVRDQSIEQFAEKAQDDYKAMFSTFMAAAAQFKSRSLFHKAEGSAEGSVSAGGGVEGSSSNETKGGSQSLSQQQYSNEVLMVQGGSQAIAAVISEMYTTGFKHELSQWLASIPRYPKPFEFQMEPITYICHNINYKQLFPVGEVDFGCFGGTTLLTENGTNRLYYVWETYDENNNTINVEKRYCDFKNQQELEDSMRRRCKALERGINVYMEEGVIPSSDIDLPAGRAGCKSSRLSFEDKRVKIRIPQWEHMTDGSKFRVIFDMPFNLARVVGASEALLVFYRGSTRQWYVQSSPGITHLYDGANNGGSGDLDNRKISVRGLVMSYNNRTGLLTVTEDDFNASRLKHPDLPEALNGLTVARVEYPSMVDEIKQHKNEFGVGTIPCNVVWSNAHRFNPIVAGGSCISFTAVSMGDIFVVFSAIPRDYETWYYVQISPDGVAIYKGATVMKFVDHSNAKSLGDPSLYESYFVCVAETIGVKTTITYGKTENNRERGHVYAVFEDHDEPLHVRFFAFGNGESPLSIMDAHVLPTSATGEHVCSGHTIDFEGTCVEHCHPECIGCHMPDSNKKCRACRNLQVDGTCVSECPPTHKPDSQNKTCICKYIEDGACVEACSAGHIAEDSSVESPLCVCELYASGEPEICLASCPAHYYPHSVSANHSECKACHAACIPQEDGFTCSGPTPGQCVQCVQINGQCANCRSGTYIKEVNGVYQCAPCAVGTMCPGDGRAYTCNKDADEYSNALRTNCVKCPTSLPYSTIPVSNRCHNCQPGYYRKPSDNSCRRCPTNTGGPNCKVQCKCTNGRCIQKTGKCSCYRGFSGDKCEIPSEGALRLVDSRFKANRFLFHELATAIHSLQVDQPAANLAPIAAVRATTTTSTTAAPLLANPVNQLLNPTFTRRRGRRGRRASLQLQPALQVEPLAEERMVDSSVRQYQLADQQLSLADQQPSLADHVSATESVNILSAATSGGKLEGRVEIFHNGQWGSICDSAWTDADAKVACKQFGYNNGTAKSNAYYGQGSGYIWLGKVQCTGAERWLKDCRHGLWGRHLCDHSGDVGVVCSHSLTRNFGRLLAQESLQFAARTTN
ncbi:uncharacterized protein LOC106160199 [Lingula anatina]|uniref:Uncharacterized protein LOC106160199 n=1 Tax=Lingula anatina TaxID=7574 RepID=A0A1S3I497_LINAN|nr:uncharacterized protein LOC106160199 [Lingula anatina]|eukprot:XP_013392189.1 uncharacterized protein LOC106160199 [Lingula anatina]